MLRRIQVFLIGVMVAGVDNMDVKGEPVDDGCSPGASLTIIDPEDWMEAEVIMGFRVWQLMFLALAGLITVVVLLCCFMKCRVPRTKQEIEADFKRKEITRRFRFLLDRIQIEDTSLRTAIEKVNELYSNREKMKRRKKKKVEDEEEIISMGSSYLFVDEKLTIKEKIKKLLGLIDDNASDIDSMKETTDKSEDLLKRSTSVDELSSLPDIKIVDPIKTRQTSEESSDSPKLEDSHSKISLLQESPQRTHGTLSRLSLLQDSPPSYSGNTSVCPEQEREVGKPVFAKNKTNSQESQDSELSVKKQDSLDSGSSPRDPKKKSKAKEFGMKTKTDSQDSGDGKYRKLKSDSQESNDSFDTPPLKARHKQIFEPMEPKLTRRESMAGHAGMDIVHKWRKPPNNKLIQEAAISQSLDIDAGPNS